MHDPRDISEKVKSRVDEEKFTYEIQTVKINEMDEKSIESSLEINDADKSVECDHHNDLKLGAGH